MSFLGTSIYIVLSSKLSKLHIEAAASFSFTVQWLPANSFFSFLVVYGYSCSGEGETLKRGAYFLTFFRLTVTILLAPLTLHSPHSAPQRSAPVCSTIPRLGLLLRHFFHPDIFSLFRVPGVKKPLPLSGFCGSGKPLSLFWGKEWRMKKVTGTLYVV
jgi:hypothetical protein